MRDSSEVAFNLQAECNRLNSELSALREENERLKSESFEELYNAAIDERDALREELASARRDVERYQKLRKVTPYRFKKMQDASVTDGGDVLYFHSDRFDALVDAELLKPEQPGVIE